jgi:hypothetical protein
MNRTSVRLSVCLLLMCCALPLMAQRAASADSIVPAMVKFTGTLNDVDGKPLTGTVGVTFLLYKEQSGGAPLWMETRTCKPTRTATTPSCWARPAVMDCPPNRSLAAKPDGWECNPAARLNKRAWCWSACRTL